MRNFARMPAGREGDSAVKNEGPYNALYFLT
ncbi:uncharacterized protein METZ01_LOCUS24025 [marine metagenome]|uniref:Uncharacterized protein n=1 Tax=marine metagenome TaxID=408172 RepID=A0A381PVT6_9ZZZZ